MDIKAIRYKAYLTQKKFAKVLGVHENTVRCWEKGTRNPSLTQQGKIVNFCKENNIKVDN